MEPLALALVLLSATLHATWNLLIARSRDTDVTMAVAVPIGALIFLPFALPTFRVEPEAWPFLITSMVLELIYVALLAAAYGRADLSLIYPLARGLAPVIVLIFGTLVLGLTNSPGEVVGVLAVGAGVMLVRGLGRGASGSADWPGTFLALAVAATIASYTLVDRQGLQYASPTAYVVLALGPPGLVYLALVARRRGMPLVRSQVKPADRVRGPGHVRGLRCGAGGADDRAAGVGRRGAGVERGHRDGHGRRLPARAGRPAAVRGQHPGRRGGRAAGADLGVDDGADLDACG